MSANDPNRREFLQAGAAGLAAAGLATGAVAPNSGGIPLRPLGKTGEMVTMLGLGGHHASRADDEAESLRLIRRAVDEGITFMDNAWDYLDGRAEERMGKALAQGGRRNKVFLMTKVCGRTAKEAKSNLEDSLRRLKTDRIDLWQFHEICYDNDPEMVFDAEGAIHAGLEALKAGKIRYLGFTGHKDPAIHLDMLKMPYDWASVQMPLNVLDGRFRSFQHRVLPELVRRGIAPIAMKSLGGEGQIVKDAGIPVEQALRYVFSLPIATLVSGMESEKVLEQNLKIAREFQPMTTEEMKALEEKYLKVAGDGRFELFKTTKFFDGPVHRKQHGFETAMN